MPRTDDTRLPWSTRILFHPWLRKVGDPLDPPTVPRLLIAWLLGLAVLMPFGAVMTGVGISEFWGMSPLAGALGIGFGWTVFFVLVAADARRGPEAG